MSHLEHLYPCKLILSKRCSKCLSVDIYIYLYNIYIYIYKYVYIYISCSFKQRRSDTSVRSWLISSMKSFLFHPRNRSKFLQALAESTIQVTLQLNECFGSAVVCVMRIIPQGKWWLKWWELVRSHSSPTSRVVTLNLCFFFFTGWWHDK